MFEIYIVSVIVCSIINMVMLFRKMQGAYPTIAKKTRNTDFGLSIIIGSLYGVLGPFGTVFLYFIIKIILVKR